MKGVRRVVISGNLPSSLSSSLYLLLLQRPSEEGVVDYLSKEEMFSLINYMLYKHFGEVLSFRFRPVVGKATVGLKIKEIRTKSGVFKVDGLVEINPVNKSIYIEIVPQENAEARAQVKAYIGSGYVVRAGEDYEVRYYV